MHLPARQPRPIPLPGRVGSRRMAVPRGPRMAVPHVHVASSLSTCTGCQHLAWLRCVACGAQLTTRDYDYCSRCWPEGEPRPAGLQ